MIAHCSFCGLDYERRRHPIPPYGLFCKATLECKRAWKNAKETLYAQRKRAEGIDIYAPYRAQQRANRQQRIADGVELHWRQERPELAARADAARRARKARRDVEDRFTRNEIAERDGWTCQICKEPVDPAVRHPDRRSASIDHAIPLARGGRHVRSNVQLAHLGCNIAKGVRLAWEML